MRFLFSAIFLCYFLVSSAQSGKYEPRRDLSNFPDTLPKSFAQKWYQLTGLQSNSISLKYSYADTINYKVVFRLEFAFPENVTKVFLHHIDSLAPLSSPGNKLLIEFDTISFINETKSIYSSGLLRVKTINGVIINKKIPGCILLRSFDNSPNLTFYLEPDPQEWYYFSYYKLVLNSVSSSQHYNTALRNSKKKYNSYYTQVCSSTKRDKFIRQVKIREEERAYREKTASP